MSWPVENLGWNLPVLVSTIQGNLYELAQFSGLKLLDLELPPSFAAHFRGPKFGVAGCRTTDRRSKPSAHRHHHQAQHRIVAAQTAELVQTLVEAGIDFIKDDELMADPPHSPFDQRVDAVMRVINHHADRTGKKVMYAFNISDELDAMQRHYDTVVQSGGTCAMISLNSVGLSGTKKICDLGALAIHGHRNGWGALNRHPLLGLEFPAYQKSGGWQAWTSSRQRHRQQILGERRLGGAFDRGVPQPLAGGMTVLPVVSSGQWGGQAPETYRRTKRWTCSTWPAAALWRIPTARRQACVRSKSGGRRRSKG